MLLSHDDVIMAMNSILLQTILQFFPLAEWHSYIVLFPLSSHTVLLHFVSLTMHLSKMELKIFIDAHCTCIVEWSSMVASFGEKPITL